MIPSLFPSGQKPHHGRKPHSMRLFEFYSRSDRPEIDRLRRYWNNVFESCQLPNAAKRDIRGRFKSKWDENHVGALFELFMYELLTQSKYQVEYQLKPSGSNPDYRVTCPNGTKLILEATCALGDELPTTKQRMHGEVYDKIACIESSNFRVSVRIRGTFSEKLNLKRFKKEVETWLSNLNHGELISIQENRKHVSDFYEGHFKAGGIDVYLHPIAIDPPRSSREHGLIMFGSVGEMQLVITDEYIYNKLKDKTSQVKDADLPVVIAINVFEAFMDHDDVLNALFGQLHHTSPVGEFLASNDEIRARRGPDGIWKYKGETRNTTISAIMLFQKVSLTPLPVQKPMMVMNPFVDDLHIPTDLPFVDYLRPTVDGLSLTPLTPGCELNNVRWEDVWPLKWKDA